MVQRIRHRSQHEINIDHWQEVTAWFMDGPGRLIKKVKSEKLCYDPNFQPLSNSSDAVSNKSEIATSAEAATSEPSTESGKDSQTSANSASTSTEAVPALLGPEDLPAVTTALMTKVKVISQDTFTAALELKAAGYNPLLLNMANAQNPGGGVYKGSMAQEEDLFRRSNYFQVAPLNEFYPLGELEVIYSPSVAVYKNPEYVLLPELTSLSCIACAAERDPKTIVNPDDPQNPFDRLYEDPHVAEITKKRIETIFQVGIKKGHDSLVLGGLGCGAFNNPQMRIIEFFNELLEVYLPFYKKIVFAVLSKRDPNFDLFSEYIAKPKKLRQAKTIIKAEPRKILRLPPPSIRPYKRVTIVSPTDISNVIEANDVTVETTDIADVTDITDVTDIKDVSIRSPTVKSFNTLLGEDIQFKGDNELLPPDPSNLMNSVAGMEDFADMENHENLESDTDANKLDVIDLECISPYPNDINT